MAKYIISGVPTSKHLPFMSEGEYYMGSTYYIQGEKYAAITTRKSEAKRYSIYQKALQGAHSIQNKCANVSNVQIIRLSDE